MTMTWKSILLMSYCLFSDRHAECVLGGTSPGPIKNFIVSLQANYKGINGHFCGAVLIHHYWLLTSAFCAKKVPMNQLWIKRILGDKLFFDHKYTPAKVIPHPHYWVEPRENDIALIKLSGPMVLGYDVPSRMQLSQSEPEGRLLFSGWGSKKKHGNYEKMEDLAQVTLDVHHTQPWIPNPGNFLTLTYSVGPCDKDEGGPLVREEPNKKGFFVLEGIHAKHTLPCGDFDNIHTKVSHYRDWILEVAPEIAHE